MQLVIVCLYFLKSYDYGDLCFGHFEQHIFQGLDVEEEEEKEEKWTKK